MFLPVPTCFVATIPGATYHSHTSFACRVDDSCPGLFEPQHDISRRLLFSCLFKIRNPACFCPGTFGQSARPLQDKQVALFGLAEDTIRLDQMRGASLTTITGVLTALYTLKPYSYDSFHYIRTISFIHLIVSVRFRWMACPDCGFSPR